MNFTSTIKPNLLESIKRVRCGFFHGRALDTNTPFQATASPETFIATCPKCGLKWAITMVETGNGVRFDAKAYPDRQTETRK